MVSPVAVVAQLKKMLHNLDRWLDSASAHVTSKGTDMKALLGARLAPDQHPLLKQIQICCDSSKFLASRLAGKEAPKHPDNETTLDELRIRLRAVTEYLGAFHEADFEGAGTREIELPFAPGKVMSAPEYVNEMALPNTYFHFVTAYSILRHSGVPLGKADYIGALAWRDK